MESKKILEQKKYILFIFVLLSREEKLFKYGHDQFHAYFEIAKIFILNLMEKNVK